MPFGCATNATRIVPASATTGSATASNRWSCSGPCARRTAQATRSTAASQSVAHGEIRARYPSKTPAPITASAAHSTRMTRTAAETTAAAAARAASGDPPAASPATAATGSGSRKASRPRGRVTGTGWESCSGNAEGNLTWSAGPAIAAA